jgi:hypothetical protein
MHALQKSFNYTCLVRRCGLIICLQQFCVPAAASGFNLLSVLEGKVDADQQQRHKRPHGFALSGSNDSLHSAGKIKAAAPLQTAAPCTR